MTILATTILVLIVSTLSLFFSSTIKFLVLSIKTRLKGLPPLPPGSLGLPIIGESLSFRSNLNSFVTSRQAKYGQIFKSNIFGTTVFLDSPAGNKFLFNNEAKLVRLTSATPVRTLIGLKAMIYKTGDSHKLARRHLTPFLKPSALAQYVPRIEQHTKNHLAKYWRPCPLPCPGTQNGEEFEVPILKSARQLAYSIITDLLLSSDEYETEELQNLHKVWFAGLSKIPINFPGSGFHRSLKARAAFLAMFDRIMARRRLDLAEGKASSAQDFLSYLLTQPDENGKMCTDEEIKDNLLLFVFAGHDTVSSALAMTLRVIALYPDVQHRLKEEHAAIAKRKNDGDSLTKEEVWEMKYTWWVIQESMRQNVSVRLGFREAIKDIEYDGFTILKGWKLSWTTRCHMDPKYFKDPEKFDPTRFSRENEIHPYTYVPFGGGTRICPGNDFARLELVIVIYYVMRNYTFTLVDPDEPVLYEPFATQRSGTLMRVTKLVSEMS